VAEILANLVENAFRYSPPGAPVGLHVAQGRSGLALTLWDGGPRIDPSERETIFERGVRGSTGLQRPGTGLGLSLAKDLALGLGGELELVIPPAVIDPLLPQEGNAFRLSLPPAASLPRPGPPHHPRATPSRPR
jgi:signal transduction histidine kinase